MRGPRDTKRRSQQRRRPFVRSRFPERTRADLNIYPGLSHRSLQRGRRQARATGPVPGCRAAAQQKPPYPACSTEDFQSAALIHDDIADKSELLRGEKCFLQDTWYRTCHQRQDSALVNVVDA